jgi:hypothetical protein
LTLCRTYTGAKEKTGRQTLLGRLHHSLGAGQVPRYSLRVVASEIEGLAILR